jgi:CDGSH-type Zn-finger protein/uncharacterized Fe-S cluster protein YjdI
MTDRESSATTRRAVLTGVGAIAITPALAEQRVEPNVGAAEAASAPPASNETKIPSGGVEVLRGGDIVRFKGKNITVEMEGKRCIHARFCVLWQPHVYRANLRPWVNPDADSAEAIAAVIHNCPSGALHYHRHDGGPSESAPKVNLLYVTENGPLAVRANMVMEGQSIGYRVTFCRCGASKNKPFCDGSHNTVKFRATGEPEAVEVPSLAARDGEVTVTPVPDGPLEMTGNLELCAHTGHTIKRVTEVRLCRCGHSQNKPYCDNSHLQMGFSSK